MAHWTERGSAVCAIFRADASVGEEVCRAVALAGMTNRLPA
jgi:hypothetical protein